MLYENIEKILEFSNRAAAKNNTDQLGMFDEGLISVKSELVLVEGEAATDKEKLAWEKEYLGAFVSDHPLRELLPKLQGLVTPIKSLTAADDNKMARIAGIVTRVQKVVTKKGDAMLFAVIEDVATTIEVIVFPKIFEATKALWERDKALIVSGKVNVKERADEVDDEIVIIAEPKILAEDVQEATEEAIERLEKADALFGKPVAESSTVPVVSRIQKTSEGLMIKIPKTVNNGRLIELKSILEKYPGEELVALELFTQGKWEVVKTQTHSTLTPELEREVAGLLR